MTPGNGIMFGPVITADLERGRVDYAAVAPDDLWPWLGGSGLALKMIVDGFDLSADPLAPESPLVIMTGLLTGTMVPTACKMSICARSPLTGLWSESTVGGYWPSVLRSTGHAGVLVTGTAPEPVYILITPEGAEIRDAGSLWGLDTIETDAALRDMHGAGHDDRGFQVLSIGPAGENLVRFASIMAGGRDGRAAGRTGMGAVMGARNLKAVVVKGRGGVRVVKRERVLDITRAAMPSIRENTVLLHDYGTAGGVPTVELVGDLPIKNWQLGSWADGAGRISGQAQAATILAGHFACHACPIRCGKEVTLRIGPHRGTVSSGPEYETCAAFGSMVLLDDVDYLALANDYANRQGIDTISAGAAVAFCMEAAERGLLDADSLGGAVRWGDGESLMHVLRLIVKRQGAGWLLGEGTRRAAREMGGLAREMSVDVKGLEVAFHDPRAFTSMAPAYGTAARGGCHLESLSYIAEGGGFPADLLGLRREWDPHDDDSKAALAAAMQDYLAVFNPLGLCKFLIRARLAPDIIASYLSAATGWDVDGDGLLALGRRLVNFRRLLSVHMGVTRIDDILPPRLLAGDRVHGGAAGSIPGTGRMLDDYYRLRGWTPEGIPTRETLEDCGLSGFSRLLPPGSD